MTRLDYRFELGLGLGLELGFGLMGKDLMIMGYGLYIIGLQLREINNMKDKKNRQWDCGLSFQA